MTSWLDHVSTLELTEAWNEQRRMVALINQYQADLKRDPGMISPYRHRRNHYTKKRAPQCV